ncbi:MAG: metal ABC transporter substrate-binding protein [Gemmatimonadota bacterium]
MRRTEMRRAVLWSMAIVAAISAMPTRASGQEPLNIVTSLTTYASIAREVVGDKGTVTAIAQGDEDAHFVQPKPSFVRLLRGADVFVTTGLDLELWVPALLDRAGNRKVSPGGPGYVTASDGVDLLEVPATVDRAAGDVHIYGNPHIHADPLNAILISRSIRAGLERVSPQNADYFRARGETFERDVLTALIGEELVRILTLGTAMQLLESHRLYEFLASTDYQDQPLSGRLDGWFGRAEGLRGQRMVCYHKEWSYFSRRFGISCAAYVESKLGIPPTPRHVRELIDLMRRENIPAIFAANYYNQNQISQVAERTGASPVIVPENTGGATGTGTYFGLVDHWIESLMRVYGEME